MYSVHKLINCLNANSSNNLRTENLYHNLSTKKRDQSGIEPDLANIGHNKEL
jgi:hypothetical protein